MQLVSRLLSGLLDALAPPCCAACDAPSATTFCSSCGPLSAPSAERQLDGAPLLTLSNYQPPLSDAIVRFKYGGRPELARGLGLLLARRLESLVLPAGAT